jgi:hypothetical protein
VVVDLQEGQETAVEVRETDETPKRPRSDRGDVR